MKAIVITPKDESEALFLSDLLRKLQVSAQEISEEDIEDAGMWQLLQEVDRSNKVSREEIMSKLRS